MPMFSLPVDTTVREIVGYNERRTSVVIFNNGAARVFISQDEAAITIEGFPLDTGGSIGLASVDGDEPELRVFAQCAAGTSELRVVESFGEHPAIRSE